MKNQAENTGSRPYPGNQRFTLQTIDFACGEVGVLDQAYITVFNLASTNIDDGIRRSLAKERGSFIE